MSDRLTDIRLLLRSYSFRFYESFVFVQIDSGACLELPLGDLAALRSDASYVG
jgi:hypothetical protein